MRTAFLLLTLILSCCSVRGIPLPDSDSGTETHKNGMPTNPKVGETPTGPKDNNSTGLKDGNSTRPQDGNSTGPQDGNSTGPQDGNSTRPQDGNSTGPQDGNSTGPQDDKSKGPQDDKSKGPQDDKSKGPQDDKNQSTNVAKGNKPGENTQHQHPADYEAESSHFFAYLVSVAVFVALLYIAYHNKRKIIAFVLEGKKSRTSRRPKSTNYQKLEQHM